jgi:hypothetical protein
MDRRNQNRTPTNVTAILNYPPLGLLSTRIRDISPAGAFVQSPSIRLNLHNTVELVANIPCDQRHLAPIRAVVVRISHEGAGLMFERPDPAYPTSLAADDPPAPRQAANASWQPPRRHTYRQ